MEDKNKMTEEDKNRKAYYALKEIQRKYGFENIAKLREFHREVTQLFLDYDRPKDSMRGEEFEPIFREIFRFISKMDTMGAEEMDKSYKELEDFLTKEKLSPKVIGFVKYAYVSRRDSDIEKLRRKMIREGRDIEKTLSDYYTTEYAKEYRMAITRALKFAFEFPTRYSDWSNPDLNKLVHGYKFSFGLIAEQMELGNIPDDIIQYFLRFAEVIPEYKLKISEAEEKRRKERQNRMN